MLQIDFGRFEFDLIFGRNGTIDTYADLEERFADLVMDATDKKGD